MECYQNPPRYRSVRKKIRQLNRTYPFVKRTCVGSSVLGRKIDALELGNREHASLYVAAVHGQEWLTTLLLLRFFEDLCRTVEKGQEILGISSRTVFEKKGLVVIPLLNPDGVEIALGGAKTARSRKKEVARMMHQFPRTWQANARGIDLNHNFDAGFSQLKEMEKAAGITSPGPRQYGGEIPHSEPETKALVDLCLSGSIEKVIAFHSQGEEIYYSYGEHTPEQSRGMAEAMASRSGYQVMEPEGLASHGGFKDWFIDQCRRPGFTIEIGKGKNPLPVRDLGPIYDRLCETMRMGILL